MAFVTTTYTPSGGGIPVKSTYDDSKALYYTNGKLYFDAVGTSVDSATPPPTFVNVGGGLYINAGEVAVVQEVRTNHSVTFEGGANLALTQAQYTALVSAL